MSAADPGADEAREILLWRIRALEQQLAATKKFAGRSTRQMHRATMTDLRAAEQRADAAERQLKRARGRARRAETELARLRASTTWRVGRAVVAVPARVRRRLG